MLELALPASFSIHRRDINDSDASDDSDASPAGKFYSHIIMTLRSVDVPGFVSCRKVVQGRCSKPETGAVYASVQLPLLVLQVPIYASSLRVQDPQHETLATESAKSFLQNDIDPSGSRTKQRKDRHSRLAEGVICGAARQSAIVAMCSYALRNR